MEQILSIAVVVLVSMNVISLRLFLRERRRREFMRKIHIYSGV